MPDLLWRPVAGCGEKLWPLYTAILSPFGWLAGRMVAGWLDGWMAGWLDGGGGHHSCNLSRSTPRRVGGLRRKNNFRLGAQLRWIQGENGQL